jgi:hypothetical protein
MSARPRDEKREQRIETEIVVDAYGPEEQALGWYYWLDGRLQFPLRARCIAERRIGVQAQFLRRFASALRLYHRPGLHSGQGQDALGGSAWALVRGCLS